LNNPNNGTTLQTGRQLDIIILDGNGTFIYNWDSNTNTTVSETFNPLIPIGEGLHQLFLYAVDDTGNWRFKYFEFFTDNPPVIILNNPLNGSTHRSGHVINLTTLGSNGSLIYDWDSSFNTTVSDMFNPILPAGEGLHQLFLFTVDDTGNWQFAYFEFITDDPPVFMLNNPLNRTTHQSGYAINISLIDTNGSLIYHWDNNPNSTTINPFTLFLPTVEGLHVLFIFAVDNSSNWSYLYLEFRTDDRPPILNLINTFNQSIHQSGTIIDFDILESDGNLIYNWDNSFNQTIFVNNSW